LGTSELVPWNVNEPVVHVLAPLLELSQRNRVGLFLRDASLVGLISREVQGVIREGVRGARVVRCGVCVGGGGH
jgi:hypothetical protein